jgi:hypothetical protein
MFKRFIDLATFVRTDGSKIMLAENLDILHFSAIAIILLFLIARIGKRKQGGFFKALVAGSAFSNDCAADRMFEKHHIPASKKCPNCAEQLPLSGLICEACDYNFLSGMVGQGYKLLPSREALVQKMSKPRVAYRTT